MALMRRTHHPAANAAKAGATPGMHQDLRAWMTGRDPAGRQERDDPGGQAPGSLHWPGHGRDHH